MSEFARAWSRSKLGRIAWDQAERKKLKDVFRAGWEAREVLAHKKIAELKKLAECFPVEHRGGGEDYE